MSAELEAERYRQYLICKERGHVDSGFSTASPIPQHKCAYCGTYYWWVKEMKERGTPVEPIEIPGES